MAYLTEQDLINRIGAAEMLRLSDRDGDGLADAGVGACHQGAFAFQGKRAHRRSPMATMSMSVKSTLSPAMAQQNV